MYSLAKENNRDKGIPGRCHHMPSSGKCPEHRVSSRSSTPMTKLFQPSSEILISPGTVAGEIHVTWKLTGCKQVKEEQEPGKIPRFLPGHLGGGKGHGT